MHKIGGVHKNEKVCLKVRGTRVLFVLDNVIIKGWKLPLLYLISTSHMQKVFKLFSATHKA